MLNIMIFLLFLQRQNDKDNKKRITNNKNIQQ